MKIGKVMFEFQCNSIDIGPLIELFLGEAVFHVITEYWVTEELDLGGGAEGVHLNGWIHCTFHSKIGRSRRLTYSSVSIDARSGFWPKLHGAPRSFREVVLRYRD
jgi:hypothetical protein